MVRRTKWLYPGMRIKRWLALLILGILIISIAFVVLLNTPVFSLIEIRVLALLEKWQPNPFLIGGLLLLIGTLLFIIGIRFGVRSLIETIRPDEMHDLVEHVYKTRNLEKGPHIVTIGGGTGLSTMLRGLKEYSANLTAIVTVADDGGSSGRIREDLGILPPGDIRNTLVALADTEPLMEKLFQYRFTWGQGLEGHTFGNLFIAAMTDITGDFEASIRAFSKVLAVRGRVLPSTLDTMRLGAIYEDGTKIMGESCIPHLEKKIAQVFIEPTKPQALNEALVAIEQADLVILGPGSLYTSIIPNLLIPGFVEALEKTSALKVYVCNVMSQPGETDGYKASDHVRAILNHVNQAEILDYVFVNNAKISTEQQRKYTKEGAYPVQADLQAIEQLNLRVHAADFLDQQDLVRHNAMKLAAEIMHLAGQHDKVKNNERRVG